MMAFICYNLSLLEFYTHVIKLDYRTGFEKYRQVYLKEILYSGQQAFHRKGLAF